MLKKEEVKHIASLARIELSQEEITKYQKELSDILGYVNMLEKLPTEGVDPIGHITGMVNRYREDKEGRVNKRERERIMENVSHKKGDFIRVKKVLN
jgi:aspartyl-tRNA(Asn)/glutamyl-tRNA(Gln) amidotransferase subunit C